MIRAYSFPSLALLLAVTFAARVSSAAPEASAGPPEKKAEKTEKNTGDAANGDRAKAEDEPGENDDFGHFGQFGLRVGVVGGYQMQFRYDESPYCKAEDAAKAPGDRQKFCGYKSPLALEAALSFALLDSVEPFLFTRLGLSGESQTDTNPLVIIGAGARFYATADSRFKVFIEPALGLELERGAGNPLYSSFNYKQDVIFHVAAGPQFDFSRAVGLYADAGLTVGVLRSIHATLELQGGLQVRFP